MLKHLVGAGLVVTVSLTTAPRQRSDTMPYRNPRLPVTVRVSDLLGRMTLDERVGQMTQADHASLKPGDVERLFLGSVLSGGSSEAPDISATWTR